MTDDKLPRVASTLTSHEAAGSARRAPQVWIDVADADAGERAEARAAEGAECGVGMVDCLAQTRGVAAWRQVGVAALRQEGAKRDGGPGFEVTAASWGSPPAI